MVAYFDTSAFVPLILSEPGSDSSAELWSRASAVVSTRLLFVEATAAISRSNRNDGGSGRLTPEQSESLERFWSVTFPQAVDEQVIRLSAECACRFGLRGYDAVHCASGAMVMGDRVVAASSDRRLLQAWADLGLATFDPLG